MRKTLVILSPGFPKDETDSTCIPDRQIFVKVLKETYPDLHIVVLAFQYPYRSATYDWNGVKVIALGGKNKSGIYRRITWVRAWLKLRRLNKQVEIVGLLSFWLDECAYIGDRFSKKYNLKHYCWLLGQDAKAGNKYVEKIKTNGENLIALSDFLVKQFNKNYGIKPKYLVPGAIDIRLFSSAQPERDIDVLGVGSLIPLKQYGLFIKTIKFLKEYLPKTKAVICGKGPEMERLKKMVTSHKLEENVEFKGELSHAEILEHMQRSKILLHPSNYEGFSTVLLEALYAGAHVVSFFRPMETPFLHHHIVKDQHEMDHKVFTLLTNDDQRIQEPVLINEMKDTAKSIMELFDCNTVDHKEAAMS
jgi:glycosyltransferase involved in cell wall biosynthesis